MPLHPAVETAVRDRFRPADVDTVLAALEAAALPLGSRAAPSERPRIQLAIVKLAEGDPARFREALRLAELDWRDTLLAAGFAHADWREAIARAGMRAP